MKARCAEPRFATITASICRSRRLSLGREAGFAQARQIFLDPTDFFRLFRFDGSAATR
jgi:hypothetical protein